MSAEAIIRAWKNEDDGIEMGDIPASPVGNADIDGSFAAAQLDTVAIAILAPTNAATVC